MLRPGDGQGKLHHTESDSWIFTVSTQRTHHTRVGNIRYVATEPDLLGSMPVSFSVPSEEVEEEGSAFGHRAVSLPSFSQSADKRAVQCQANSPQPTGYRLDDREQIKQKDECSLGGSGSISDSSDPRQFLSSLPLPFLLLSLALILLLKVTAGNTENLRAQVQSSVFFGWWHKVTFTEPSRWYVIRVFPHLSHSIPHSVSVVFSTDTDANWPQSYCVPDVRDSFKCALFFSFWECLFWQLKVWIADLSLRTWMSGGMHFMWKWNEKWKAVFISPRSKYPKGRVRIHNPNNS